MGAKQPVQLGSRLAGFEQCIFGEKLAEAAELSVRGCIRSGAGGGESHQALAHILPITAPSLRLNRLPITGLVDRCTVNGEEVACSPAASTATG